MSTSTSISNSQDEAPAESRRQFPLGFVGYGEVASHYARGLHAQGFETMTAFDPAILAADDASERIKAAMEEAGVEPCYSLDQLAETCSVILGLAPGSASLAIAKDLSAMLSSRHIYADLASAGAEVKRTAAEAIISAGACFVDGAVMSHATVDLHTTRLIVSGDGAEEFADMLRPWGARVSVIGTEPGAAAVFKNLRSVLSKGLEAVIFECVEAADHFGLADAVTTSLAELMDARESFIDSIDYHLTSGIQHARRRAEEMAMAAETVRSAGVEPIMTLAAAMKLGSLADLPLDEDLGGAAPANSDQARRLLARARSPKPNVSSLPGDDLSEEDARKSLK